MRRRETIRVDLVACLSLSLVDISRRNVLAQGHDATAGVNGIAKIVTRHVRWAQDAAQVIERRLPLALHIKRCVDKGGWRRAGMRQPSIAARLNLLRLLVVHGSRGLVVKRGRARAVCLRGQLRRLARRVALVASIGRILRHPRGAQQVLLQWQHVGLRIRHRQARGRERGR